jgi:hypothetical protein
MHEVHLEAFSLQMVLNLWYRSGLELASMVKREPKYMHHLVQNHLCLAQKRICEHDKINTIVLLSTQW